MIHLAGSVPVIILAVACVAFSIMGWIFGLWARGTRAQSAMVFWAVSALVCASCFVGKTWELWSGPNRDTMISLLITALFFHSAFFCISKGKT
jgi:hypothetical protein